MDGLYWHLGKLWPGEHSTIWKRFWDPKWAENLKCDLFIASVECLLLYGSEFRTLTATEEGTLNGCHTLIEAHDTRSVMKRTYDQLRVSWQPTESLRQDESLKTENSWTLHRTLKTICKSYPLGNHTRQGTTRNEVFINWYAEVEHRICKPPWYGDDGYYNQWVC
jgi:hypothetical protein